MVLSFVDLPNEILLRILLLLVPEDINNLFSISQFRQRLQEFVKLIKDQQETHFFTNIPLICHHILNEGDEAPSLGLLEILEITNFDDYSEKLLNVNDQIPKMITVLDKFKRMNYEIIGLLPAEDKDSRTITRYVQKQGATHSGFTYLSFINLTNLALEEVKVDPLSINLPNLKAIHFIRCTSSNEDVLFNFPNLKYLQVTGMVKSLDKSFDYSQYPINLELYQAKGWYRSNTEFLKLKKLVIRSFQHDTLCAVEDCYFPELRDASFNQTKFLLLNEINAPELIRLSFNSTSEPVTLEDIYAPKLIHMDISSTILPYVNTLYAPHLEYAFADIQNVASENPDSYILFESIPGLIIREHPLALLERIDTRNIQYLCVDLEDDDLEIFDLAFPHLRCVELSLADTYTRLPHLHAPNLKQLVIVDCPALESLKNIPTDYAFIEELRLDLYESDLVLEGLTFPNLKTLEIITEGLYIRVEDCNFPALERFSITGTMFQTPTTIEFEAPRLLDYKLVNVDIDELSIVNFPNLQRLSVNRVQDLELKNLDSLVYLNLSYNIFRKLDLPDCLPNLRYLEALQSNATEFSIVSGLNMSDVEREGTFGSRYDRSLDSIPLQDFEGLSSCLDSFYQRLSDGLVQAL